MKKILLSIIIVLCIINAVCAQTREASYPLANGHKVTITNLLKPELWGLFDNAGLANDLDKISTDFELDTDFSVAFNPTATYLYLPVQGIVFDLKKASKIAAYAKDKAAFLPNDLQKNVMQAVATWALSLIRNPKTPADLVTPMNQLILSSPPRFICSISNNDRYIVLSGTLPALRSVSFSPKIQWQDLSNAKAPFTATITVPAPYNDYAFTSVQSIMYLENPDTPGNVTLKKDSIWIYKLFGLR